MTQRCETTWMMTSKEARSAQTLRRHHFCYFVLMTLADARHPGDAHHHVEVVTTSTSANSLFRHPLWEGAGVRDPIKFKETSRLPHRQGCPNGRTFEVGTAEHLTTKDASLEIQTRRRRLANRLLLSQGVRPARQPGSQYR